MSTEKRLEPASFKLLASIAQLDKLSFPDCPIEEIVIIKKRKDEDCAKSFLAGYSGKNSNFRGKGEEFYAVYACLDEVIWDLLRKSKHIYFNDLLSNRSWDDLQPMSEEELLIGLAAHEVRHRVQQHSKIALFSSENKNKQKTKNPDLRAIIAFVAMKIEKTKFRIKKEFLEEFDARVIEYLAAKKWHEGATFQDLAKIVKENAEKIQEETSSYFLFFDTYIVPQTRI